MGKDVDLVPTLSDRALLPRRGRIGRELPAAGLDGPAPEHEFIG